MVCAHRPHQCHALPQLQSYLFNLVKLSTRAGSAAAISEKPVIDLAESRRLCRRPCRASIPQSHRHSVLRCQNDYPAQPLLAACRRRSDIFLLRIIAAPPDLSSSVRGSWSSAQTKLRHCHELTQSLCEYRISDEQFHRGVPPLRQAPDSLLITRHLAICCTPSSIR
jgi:hypothetical protein